MKNQIPAGINFSLSNIPYWNSDTGGFFLSKFRKKLEDAEYRELYARWIHFGDFCPMMRSHGTDAPREIYQFGKKGDRVYDVIEKYIILRYSLLPYIYSVAWDVTENQSTMMRAPVMDFPEDRAPWQLTHWWFSNMIIGKCFVTNQYPEPYNGFYPVYQAYKNIDGAGANLESLINLTEYLGGHITIRFL